MTDYILTVENIKTGVKTSKRGLFTNRDIAELKKKLNTLAPDKVHKLVSIEPVNVDYAKQFLNSLKTNKQ